MPATTYRINIPVDEIEIIGGPGHAAMRVTEALSSPYVQLYDNPGEKGLRVTFDARTPASQKSFKLRVELFRIQGRRTEIPANQEEPADEITFSGQAGEWVFSGTYNVHDRTGRLHYFDYDEMTSLPS